MGPKGKSIRGKRGKGNTCKERDEEEGEKGGEQQQQYQEMMAIGSDREEAVEDDDKEEGEPSRRQFDSVEDEVTGKLRKEKCDFDATTEQKLVDYFGEHESSKGVKMVCILNPKEHNNNKNLKYITYKIPFKEKES